LEFVIRVYVPGSSRLRVRQCLEIQTWGRWFIGSQVLREVPHDLITASTVISRAVGIAHCKVESQFLRQWAGMVSLVGKGVEALQEKSRVLAAEPQGTTQLKVDDKPPGEHALEGSHGSPPGKGRATAFRLVVSTLV